MMTDDLNHVARSHLTPKGVAKVSYATLADAQDAAKAEQERNGSNRRPYQGYECPYCHRFHIGRKPAAPSARRKSAARPTKAQREGRK